MNPAGLLFDSSPHYLDHLGPFCALLDWPLIICDPSIFENAKKFYPNLRLIEAPGPFGLGEWISKQFTHIVSCSPRPLLQAALGGFSFEPIWLPHGNSDKGQISPYFEALHQESTLLVYGQKMSNFLKRDSILAERPRIIQIGSFRNLYYQKMASFYDKISLNYSFENPSLPTLLYAPTWEDSEGNCSFWNAFEILSRTLPASINLLVKPHPNTIHAHAPRIERLIGQHRAGNLQFLLDLPLIYPLLSRCSALLGDRSSIGYDFLHFDRPMLFLDPHSLKNGRDLLSCGLPMAPDRVFQCDWYAGRENLFQKRRSMRSFVFDEISLKELRLKVLSATDGRKHKNGTQIV
jgi:hypothetical protein